jgi:hemerythrin-like metal-binding protein
MAELTWSDKSAIGVEAIDEEHKELFEAMGELESAVTRNAGAEETGALLGKLAATTGKHFADEEALMREAKYSGIAMHTANHQRLMEKINAFVARLNRNGAEMNQHDLNFLRDWLVYHIENDDRRLGDWLKDRVRDLARAAQQKQALERSA